MNKSAKMKIIYISPSDLSIESGTTKKMLGQIKAFKNEGFQIEPIYPSNGNIIYKDKTISKYSLMPYFSFFDMLSKLYKTAMDIALKEAIKIFYIRFSLFEWNLINFSKIAKKQEMKVFLEMPSFPYEQEYMKKNFLKKYVLHIDRFFRKKVNKYIDAIFTPSKLSTSSIFTIPAFHFDNGVDPEKITPRTIHNFSNISLNILGVAKISSWHGYDRIIRGIYDYKKHGGESEINLIVVGTGDELNSLRKLVRKLNLSNNVTFSGFKSGAELDKIYDVADIGVDAIGIHRKQLSKISSLKSREYCLKSLPFIIIDGVDDDFINFDFSIKVKSDESPIDVNFLIEEFMRITSLNYLQEMRVYGEKNLSWEKKIDPIIKKINDFCLEK